MQAGLIFLLRAHLESSSQMSKTAGISHIGWRKKTKKTKKNKSQLHLTREGDEEAQTVHRESDLFMMTGHTFTDQEQEMNTW